MKLKIIKTHSKFNTNQERGIKLRWTEGKEEQLLHLKNEGLTYKEIAKILNSTVSAITKRIAVLKYKQRPDIVKCPQCNQKNAVGITITYEYGNVTSAYYCNQCLIEFKKNKILEPMLI